MQLTTNDLLVLLAILAVGMIIVLLYHLIFVSVYLRRIVERVDSLTKEVEAVIIKPLRAIETAMELVSALMGGQEEDKHGKHKGKRRKEEGESE